MKKICYILRSTKIVFGYLKQEEMYPSLFKEEEDGFRESEEDKGFYSSEDDQFTYSDQEEIEQALYAQIHYCQDTDYDEDCKEFDNKCLEIRNDHNSIDLYDRQITVKSLNKIDNKKSLETDKSTSTENRVKKKKENIKVKKAKINKTDHVIFINSQSSDSEAISFSSDNEINMSSDIDIDIDSDDMMLDETFDMGDIVINIHDNQKTMLKNLTVRNIKEHEKDTWCILDQDRFLGNPLLGRNKKPGRYYKQLSVRCHNCNEVGHLSKVCHKPKKVVVCYLCGESGHSGNKCSNPICYNCNKPGHVASDCTGPRRSRYIDCHRCQMLGHTSYECPEIWRQFHLTTVHGALVRAKRQEQQERHRKHCSNCAGSDHFDFECEEERMDRHVLPLYPFISQYRNFDVKMAKRQREIIQGDECKNIAKRRKLDNKHENISINVDTVGKRSINNVSQDRKTDKKKNKYKEKKKKEENFRKMMDNDDATFWDKKNKTNKKQHKNKYVEKKKKEKKKTLSLEEEYYGPLSKLKKKKNKFKKDKKKFNKSPSNSSKGFKVHNRQFNNQQ